MDEFRIDKKCKKFVECNKLFDEEDPYKYNKASEVEVFKIIIK